MLFGSVSATVELLSKLESILSNPATALFNFFLSVGGISQVCLFMLEDSGTATSVHDVPHSHNTARPTSHPSKAG